MMNDVVAERMERIKQLACTAFDVEPDRVTTATLFEAELGGDSLGSIDLLAALETEYGVEIDQEVAPRLASVEAAYEVVAELAGWSPIARERAGEQPALP